MKTSFKQLGLFTALALLTLPSLAASENASQASKHSALAAAHSTVATAKVASGVVAAPLMVSGATGKAAGKAGDVLMEFALEDEPLEITDQTVTADPAPRNLKVSDQQEI